ncbi:unnamed protein product [Brassica napus]|uniref:(rape) hypothetical protein n=1 Tax=Brassica napus TaxID=3708 RepID=A0A816XB54_BRANA|nr:unnamed protein product [Brassica napus]
MESGVFMILEEMEISHLGLVSQGDYRVVTELLGLISLLRSDLAFVPFYLSEMLVTTNLVGTINICILQESSPPLSSIILGPFSSLYKISGPFRYLNNNYLTGGIPAQLSNLNNLEIVYLSYNKFTGNIPFAPFLTFLS